MTIDDALRTTAEWRSMDDKDRLPDRLRFVACERSGDWAALLRMSLNASTVRLCETRTLEDCWNQLLQFPTSIAMIELTAANAKQLVATLLRLQRDLPEARAIVVAKRQLAGHGRLMREAGAIHFVISPRSLAAVADIVRRRRIELDVAAIHEIDDTVDPQPAIIANLPWSV